MLWPPSPHTVATLRHHGEVVWSQFWFWSGPLDTWYNWVGLSCTGKYPYLPDTLRAQERYRNCHWRQYGWNCELALSVQSWPKQTTPSVCWSVPRACRCKPPGCSNMLPPHTHNLIPNLTGLPFINCLKPIYPWRGPWPHQLSPPCVGRIHPWSSVRQCQECTESCAACHHGWHLSWGQWRTGINEFGKIDPCS